MRSFAAWEGVRIENGRGDGPQLKSGLVLLSPYLSPQNPGETPTQPSPAGFSPFAGRLDGVDLCLP